MRLTERCLRLVYRVGARVFYGSDANVDWIYEKVQRPRNAALVAANLLYFYLRQPRVPGFISLQLEPVFGCNLHCAYCWGKHGTALEGRRPHLMSWETFRRAIDTAPPSIESVTIGCFGEPLLHPRLFQMINYAHASGRRVVLYSNGTLLTGERLTQLAQTPLSVLSVSVEPDAETMRTFRGVELDVIRRNVELFAQRKRPQTEINLSIVAHAGNYDLIPEVAKEWGSLAKSIKVGPMIDFDGVGLVRQCAEPWRGNVMVLSDGNVSPCCVDAYADLIIGDVNVSSLRDIVRGSAFTDLLARFICGDAPSRCVHCVEYAAPGLPVKAPKRPPVRRGRAT